MKMTWAREEHRKQCKTDSPPNLWKNLERSPAGGTLQTSLLAELYFLLKAFSEVGVYIQISLPLVFNVVRLIANHPGPGSWGCDDNKVQIMNQSNFTLAVWVLSPLVARSTMDIKFPNDQLQKFSGRGWNEWNYFLQAIKRRPHTKKKR